MTCPSEGFLNHFKRGDLAIIAIVGLIGAFKSNRLMQMGYAAQGVACLVSHVATTNYFSNGNLLNFLRGKRLNNEIVVPLLLIYTVTSLVGMKFLPWRVNFLASLLFTVSSTLIRHRE